MKKTHKIANIVLIFTLIWVFSGQSLAYASDIADLRVPIGNYERLEKSLNLNPIRKVDIDSLRISEMNKGNFTVVREARYIDENGVTHDCFAKYSRLKDYEKDFIIPQARILRFLNSRNIRGIPRVLDFVEHADGSKIILFEKFPPGATLEAMSGDVSMKEAVNIMLEVARIVKSLLDLGVYHWDIKPENIWVTDAREVILFDFDLAFMGRDEFIARKLYISSSRGYTSERRGRLGHESLLALKKKSLLTFPEGKILFSSADEIFSLGKSLKLLLEQNRSQTPPDLHGLINRALVVNGADEYKTIDEFLGDLEKVKASMSSPGKLAERLIDIHHANSNI